MAKALETKFVVCLRNEGADDLEVRKVYATVADEAAESSGFLRVLDESGEDYLYPAEFFAPVEISAETAQALAPANPSRRLAT